MKGYQESIVVARILARDIVDRRNRERNIGETTILRQKIGIELNQMFEADIHSWITKKVHENRLNDPIVAALYEIITQQL